MRRINLADPLLSLISVGRRILAITSIFSLFVLSWVMVRSFAPLNCINSTFIDNFHIVGTSAKGQPEATVIAQCSLRERVWGPIVAEGSLAQAAIKRVQAFEKMRMFWPDSKGKAAVEIVTGNEDSLNFNEGTLKIHARRLKAGDQFERGLLTLLNPASSDPSSLMTREVVADFFWATQKSAPINPTHPWMSHFKSLSTYCASKDHLISHAEFCELRKKLGDGLVSPDSDSGAVSWSLMPVLSHVLRTAFATSTLNDQFSILERVFFLSEWNDEDLFDPSVETIAGLELRFRETIAAWLKPLDLKAFPLEKALADVSLFANRKYHYVVLGDDEFNSIFEVPELSGIIFEHNSSKYFAPSDVPLRLPRKEILSSLPIEDIVFVGCEWPSPSELLQFSEWAKNAFFIQTCGKKTWKWEDLVRKGAIQLAVANPNVHFIEFNLKSLKLAQKLKGPFRGSSAIRDWQKWLGWTEVKTEKRDNFSRPVTSLEGISRFRLSETKN